MANIDGLKTTVNVLRQRKLNYHADLVEEAIEELELQREREAVIPSPVERPEMPPRYDLDSADASST